MDGPIAQIRPHPLQQPLHLLDRPPQTTLLPRPRQHRQTKRGQPAADILAVPPPNQLVPPVPGPPVRRPLVPAHNDIHKARRSKLRFVVHCRVDGAMEARHGGAQEGGPAEEGRGAGDGVVVGEEGPDGVLQLEGAARREGVVALGEEGGPVADAAGQEAGKDEVEGRGERPGVFEVVDDERDVRRGAG